MADQAASGAVQQPPDIDRQLLRLRTRQKGAEAQGVQEPTLPYPSLLVDKGVLHDRDLPSGTTEGL